MEIIKKLFNAAKCSAIELHNFEYILRGLAVVDWESNFKENLFKALSFANSKFIEKENKKVVLNSLSSLKFLNILKYYLITI